MLVCSNNRSFHFIAIRIIGFSIFVTKSRLILCRSSSVSTLNKSVIAQNNTDSDEFNGNSVRNQCNDLLKQKLYILRTVNENDYVKKMDDFYHASIGSHIRHSLDHTRKIIELFSDKANDDSLNMCQQPSNISNDAVTIENTIIDYDSRERNTLIETNKKEAIIVVENLIKLIPSIDMTRIVYVKFMGNSKTFSYYTIPSTVMRELSFTSHHAVHHLSIVRLMMNSLNYSFIDNEENGNIGIAVSTIKNNHDKNNI
eukprot:gene6086-8388_t